MLESRFLRIIQAIGSTRMVVAAMIELVGGSSILNAPRQRRTTLKQVDSIQYYSQVSNPSVTVMSMKPKSSPLPPNDH